MEALGYNSRVASTRRRPRLGQHFLSSPGYRRRIVEALFLRPDDLVVEIGPGRGAMTELLADRVRCVVAVELDASLAGELKEKLRTHPRIEIVQADILASDLSAICREHQSERCFVFGNLPYYITSPIIHRLMDSAEYIWGMALLVQREVAERLTAVPGGRDYGFLSVLARLHSEPRIVLRVPAGAFSPPPMVQSALVDFIMRPKFPEWSAQERAQFLAFVKICFAQKRKNLANNIRKLFGREKVAEAIRAVGLPLTSRAEQISIGQMSNLFHQLA